MKLFISYRSLDSAKVDSIVAHLRSLKTSDNTLRYHVWQDKTGIPDGQDWWESIIDAIIDCDVFVFMVSRSSVQNSNCHAELSYARKRNRPIIAIVLGDEFSYNPVSGKNELDYWYDIPQELNDLRSQFLFYETTSFLVRFETALDYFQREPQRWRDMKADRPRDPRHASDETNNSIVLYDEACDYAWRLEFNTAERLFQKLVNINDTDFSEEAHQWVMIIRDYQKLMAFDSHNSTRHRVRPAWEHYIKQFPVPFTDLFDPKDFKSRYYSTTIVVPFTLPKPKRGTVPELLPAPFEWIDIPAGKVTLEVGGYVKKNTTFDVPAFTISQYPITNAQFRSFIEADGYIQPQWWTDAGWQIRKKEKWTEARFWQESEWNQANYPVVGVSWYESLAFCAWLSQISGEEILLPTEQQWQWAAQGYDGRRYPWGNDWNINRCNTKESGIGQTTPVNQYESKGASPFGVVDMVGNVWEWCLTAYETGSNIVHGTDARILRGGSFNRSSDTARCAVRNSNDPSVRSISRGFHMVLCPQ